MHIFKGDLHESKPIKPKRLGVHTGAHVGSWLHAHDKRYTGRSEHQSALA